PLPNTNLGREFQDRRPILLTSARPAPFIIGAPAAATDVVHLAVDRPVKFVDRRIRTRRALRNCSRCFLAADNRCKALVSGTNPIDDGWIKHPPRRRSR